MVRPRKQTGVKSSCAAEAEETTPAMPAATARTNVMTFGVFMCLGWGVIQKKFTPCVCDGP